VLEGEYGCDLGWIKASLDMDTDPSVHRLGKHSYFGYQRASR
jgi:hypothetical protein